MIHKFVGLVVASVIMLMGLVVITPQNAYAATNCADAHFLTFPAWYRGLTETDCSIKSPDKVGGLSAFIIIIAMNFLEMLFQAVAYISVGYIIWGGFKYITTYGEPNEIVVARQRILNAIIGLVIAMLAVGIVNFLGSKI
jgi:hypothetical protein